MIVPPPEDWAENPLLSSILMLAFFDTWHASCFNYHGRDAKEGAE
jgi:hypothetical protein